MRRLLPLLLACWATVAGADTWLVSVGIERYDDADTAPVKYACGDARAEQK